MPNWFGPVEAEVRDRAREFLQATYESELGEVRGLTLRPPSIRVKRESELVGVNSFVIPRGSDAL